MARIGYPQFREHREGFDINVEMYPDTETTPGPSYSPGAISAWSHTDWRFVRVRVTAGRKGLILGEASRSGFEYGWLPHPADGPITQIFKSPIDQGTLHYDPDALESLTRKAVDAARENLCLTCDVAG